MKTIQACLFALPSASDEVSGHKTISVNEHDDKISSTAMARVLSVRKTIYTMPA